MHKKRVGAGKPISVNWSWEERVTEGSSFPRPNQLGWAANTMREEAGRASTQTGGLPAFSEKGPGSSEGKLVWGKSPF